MTTIGAKIYDFFCSFFDSLAKMKFVQTFGHTASVRHPVFLVNQGHVSIGENFVSGPGLRLEVYGDEARFSAGARVCLNWNVHIGVINEVILEDDVLIGSNVLITDHGHGETTREALEKIPLDRGNVSKGRVVIESGAWIGENVSILGGVVVGKHSVVGANSLVTKDVPRFSVVGGVPARILSENAKSGRRSD